MGNDIKKKKTTTHVMRIYQMLQCLYIMVK